MCLVPGSVGFCSLNIPLGEGTSTRLDTAGVIVSSTGGFRVVGVPGRQLLGPTNLVECSVAACAGESDIETCERPRPPHTHTLDREH